MVEINARQAMVPEGATVLENSRGTAPGLWMESDGRIVILLPGPPNEMQTMFARQVAERLMKRGRRATDDAGVAGRGNAGIGCGPAHFADLYKV